MTGKTSTPRDDAQVPGIVQIVPVASGGGFIIPPSALPAFEAALGRSYDGAPLTDDDVWHVFGLPVRDDAST